MIYKEKKYNEAIYWFDEIIKLDPKDYESWYLKCIDYILIINR